MINLYDQYGKRICVGDIVTYPVRKGSGMWMNTGKVEDIYNTGIKLSDTTTGRIKHIQNIDNVTIVYHSNTSMLDDWARNKVRKVDELERRLESVIHSANNTCEELEITKTNLWKAEEDCRTLKLENESLKETMDHLKDQLDVLLVTADKDVSKLNKQNEKINNLHKFIDEQHEYIAELKSGLHKRVENSVEQVTSFDTELSDKESTTVEWFRQQGLSEQDMLDLCIVGSKTENNTDLISKYEEFVRRTSKSDVKAQTNEDVNNPVWSGMALAAEVGELLSMIKKIKQGKLGDMWYNDLVKEFGDVMWYLTKLMLIHDTNLNEALRTNMDKLSKRFGI